MCCLYLSQNTLKFLLWLLPLTRWLLKSAFVSAYFWIFQFCFCCGFLVSFCCGWKDPFYDFNILKFLKTSFVASIWFILEDFPYALGKKKRSILLGLGGVFRICRWHPGDSQGRPGPGLPYRPSGCFLRPSPRAELPRRQLLPQNCPLLAVLPTFASCLSGCPVWCMYVCSCYILGASWPLLNI